MKTEKTHKRFVLAVWSTPHYALRRLNAKRIRYEAFEDPREEKGGSPDIKEKMWGTYGLRGDHGYLEVDKIGMVCYNSQFPFGAEELADKLYNSCALNVKFSWENLPEDYTRTEGEKYGKRTKRPLTNEELLAFEQRMEELMNR